MKDRALPARVFPKGKRYYLVKAEGKRRVWIKLSRISEGLPAMYLALSKVVASEISDDRMPALIADWQSKVMSKHAEKTQRDELAYCRAIGNGLADFTAEQVTPADVTTYLEEYEDKPRTFNAHRAILRELMRYAIQRNMRAPGTNPVDSVPTMTVRPRTRYITDSELRRIKVAGMYGLDGRRTPSGPMLCALIDMAYLTAQRIGDLLTLEWPAIGDRGIQFQTSKTDAAILIEWTPRLRDVVRRLREMRLATKLKPAQVFATQAGRRQTYNGAHTAWYRAVQRAGVAGVHFHDLRAKALTDKEAREGMQEARKMGTHTTEQQTSDYVRNRTSAKTGATR